MGILMIIILSHCQQHVYLAVAVLEAPIDVVAVNLIRNLVFRLQNIGESNLVLGVRLAP